MIPTQGVYRNDPSGLTVLFDHNDAQQRALLQVFQDAFGEHRSHIETLDSSHLICLHLYPGGAREMAA